MKPLITPGASPAVNPGNLSSAAAPEFLAMVQHFRKGDVIYLKNDPANFFYQIERGQVRIEDTMADGEIVPRAIFTAGRWLGVLPLPGARRFQDTAICLTDCTVRRIAVHHLRRQLEEQPRLYHWLLMVAGSYLESLGKRNRILSVRVSADRVIRFLDDWIHTHGQRVGFELVVREVLPHREIALYTNTSRQTVATLFNELRRDGIIHYTRRYIIVRDPARWAALVRSGSAAGRAS